MNNIEILEERINFCKNNTECREELNQCFGCTFEIEEIQAIENLIQENKELKEERKLAYNLGYRNGCNDTSKFNDKEFIRKSKVKEKIEELEEQLKYNLFKTHEIYTVVENRLIYKIEVLKELLEEGE